MGEGGGEGGEEGIPKVGYVVEKVWGEVGVRMKIEEGNHPWLFRFFFFFF